MFFLFVDFYTSPELSRKGSKHLKRKFFIVCLEFYEWPTPLVEPPFGQLIKFRMYIRIMFKFCVSF